MKVVIFGLTVSSSWGNGHATLWRGLVAALARRGHDVTFFERDAPWYAQNRDRQALPAGRLTIYPDWPAIETEARGALRDADVAIVTSYCPDARKAEEAVLEAPRAVRVFYDLDTPVTLAALSGGARPAYVGPRGFADYDLVLSYTGGGALQALRERLGARRVAPLYGHVDPREHRPVAPDRRYGSALSYLGTYADDRQPVLERLFVEPARRRPDLTFLIGGAQYPDAFPWERNINFARHVPPPEHPAFFSSSRMTLNVTRAAMAAMGHCPSGRLFEAAACGTAVMSDAWDGLDAFFEPGREILVLGSTDDALGALALGDDEVARIAGAGRERVLGEHTSDHRALAFEAAVETVRQPDAAETA